MCDCRWHADNVTHRQRRLPSDQTWRRSASSTQCRRSQWSSGSMLACGARDPRIELRCGQKFLRFSHKKTPRYAALGTGCTLTAVPKSTQPFTLRGTVNEYQPYGWVIIQRRWANVWPIAAYRRTQRSSLQLGLRVGGHLALTNFRPDDPVWTLASGWHRIDDNIIILVLLLFFLPSVVEIPRAKN